MVVLGKESGIYRITHSTPNKFNMNTISGGASPKYWGGPQKIILIYKLNMQIILYAKYSNYNKHILDYKKKLNYIT
jgi:hypothetical protein